MKPIGGYFELELESGKEFYTNSIKLHTGRNCLEYILRAYHFRKILLPNYICDVVLEPILTLGLEFEFYNLDKNLDPIIPMSIEPGTAFLYVNYFGVKQKTVDNLTERVKNLIVDNTQAFYATTVEWVPSFNSARKFFGVADGAYLFCKERLETPLPIAKSVERINHLVERIDIGAEEGYASYQANDIALRNQPMLQMSALTHRILDSVNYDFVRQRRIDNFTYLHDHLCRYNLLKLDINLDKDVPMVYPLLVESRGLRKKLIESKIFVATYWPNSTNWYKQGSVEEYLKDNIIALPIDQRYGMGEMSYIVQKIVSIYDSAERD